MCCAREGAKGVDGVALAAAPCAPTSAAIPGGARRGQPWDAAAGCASAARATAQGFTRTALSLPRACTRVPRGAPGASACAHTSYLRVTRRAAERAAAGISRHLASRA